MREFAFELRLCAHLEGDGIVARQLGAGARRPGRRIVDVVRVTPGSEFDARRRLTAQTIPDLALQASVPVGRAVSRRSAFAGLEVSPERQREVVDRAVEIGFLERERQDGQTMLRQVAPYPDWFDGLTAIENKPDLSNPGSLAAQLRFDLALSIFDRVILATESYVSGAHRNRIPAPVGIWRLHDGTVEVIREPARLDPTTGGTEIRAENPGETAIELVPGNEIARARRRIAERAYGKGFRTYALPGCANVSAIEHADSGGLPYCSYHEQVIDPERTCGPSCPGFDPASAPEVDLEAARGSASPWQPDPPRAARIQSRLGHFRE